MDLVTPELAKIEVLRIQRKFYQWSEQGTYSLKRLYNLIYNPYVLSRAWFALAGNRGSRTAGVDGVTRKVVEERIGIGVWLTSIEKSCSPTTDSRSTKGPPAVGIVASLRPPEALRRKAT